MASHCGGRSTSTPKGQKVSVPERLWKTSQVQLSGVLKGLLKLQVQSASSIVRPYPIFAGTGISVDGLGEEANSGVAKYSYADAPQPPFTAFRPQAPTDVKKYLSRYLNLDGVSEEVQQHVWNWLRGRPRWAATFLEEFLIQTQKKCDGQTKGRFNENEEKVISALDRYVADMTNEDRRQSWSGGNRTAYSAFGVFDYGGKNTREALNEVEQVIYRFALGQQPEVLRNETKELIMHGVAALHTEESNVANGVVVAYIDEPLVVEAGIQYYGLESIILRAFKMQENGGHGDGFEKICLYPFGKSSWARLSPSSPKMTFWLPISRQNHLMG